MRIVVLRERVWSGDGAARRYFAGTEDELHNAPALGSEVRQIFTYVRTDARLLTDEDAAAVILRHDLHSPLDEIWSEVVPGTGDREAGLRLRSLADDQDQG